VGEADLPPQPRDEPPPPTGSWGRLYAVVLGNLALMVLLFWLFTRLFA
jgi:hypothetical protein